MVKDIIVNLSVTKEGSVVGKYAVSVAAALEAHLTGVAFIYDPVVPISGAGYISAEVIEIQREDNETAADAAIKSFTAATDQAGISAEPLITNASLAGAGDHFARMARRFDLAIVGQAEPEISSMEQIIGETTLFESGRPMIMVPYIQKAPFKTDNVMICWDGSRTAARAVADAIPIIRKSGRVEIVIVASDRGKQDEIEGADIGQHLARHGLKVDVHRISGGNIDVGDALLSHAADSGADFMVMGGYGHSRLREFVLGGVTRSIFGSMTLPVLLSH
ncbi:MAG TPA: universal stress protein [Xanthobacteraceae bacterium]|jgi:nucleotide-binding universal stress UspA family protein|nr:universal stress protein [Xanthobacteraceae bacterium]